VVQENTAGMQRFAELLVIIAANEQHAAGRGYQTQLVEMYPAY
jgi:hypothetical protein